MPLCHSSRAGAKLSEEAAEAGRLRRHVSVHSSLRAVRRFFIEGEGKPHEASYVPGLEYDIGDEGLAQVSTTLTPTPASAHCTALQRLRPPPCHPPRRRPPARLAPPNTHTAAAAAPAATVAGGFGVAFTFCLPFTLCLLFVVVAPPSVCCSPLGCLELPPSGPLEGLSRSCLLSRLCAGRWSAAS